MTTSSEPAAYRQPICISEDEFGNVVSDTAPGFQPFGFAGGLYDPDTKFVRFGARDYDAGAGRWTAKEQIGFAGSSNFYTYGHADPVNQIDINGMRDYPSTFIGPLQPGERTYYVADVADPRLSPLVSAWGAGAQWGHSFGRLGARERNGAIASDVWVN